MKTIQEINELKAVILDDKQIALTTLNTAGSENRKLSENRVNTCNDRLALLDWVIGDSILKQH